MSHEQDFDAIIFGNPKGPTHCDSTVQFLLHYPILYPSGKIGEREEDFRQETNTRESRDLGLKLGTDGNSRAEMYLLTLGVYRLLQLAGLFHPTYLPHLQGQLLQGAIYKLAVHIVVAVPGLT